MSTKNGSNNDDILYNTYLVRKQEWPDENSGDGDYYYADVTYDTVNGSGGDDTIRGSHEFEV